MRLLHQPAPATETATPMLQQLSIVRDLRSRDMFFFHARLRGLEGVSLLKTDGISNDRTSAFGAVNLTR